MGYFDVILDVDEFPYRGTFFTDIDEQNDVWEVVYDGEMDIQVTTPEMGYIAQDSHYAVFMPMPKDSDEFIIPIKKGDRFIGYQFNTEMKGIVRNVNPSQLGKMTVYIARDTW